MSASPIMLNRHTKDAKQATPRVLWTCHGSSSVIICVFKFWREDVMLSLCFVEKDSEGVHSDGPVDSLPNHHGAIVNQTCKLFRFTPGAHLDEGRKND